jgi:hypothetical protein
MGIDRIGKGGGAPPSAPSTPPQGSVGPLDRAQRPEKAFEVRPERAAEASQAQAPQSVARSPLERLRAGEIDVDQYVDLKVDQATAHLRGLRATEIDAIRGALREQLAGDPALVDLVRQATGRTPTPRE